ncbi:MAG: nitroreductase family protein [Melioribacteraceae bacterium]|nr:nitroreductase family protein [Melioribacteraceae bacterium]
MKNFINKEICSGCKLCIKVCPCNCFEANAQDEIIFKAERESVCLKCLQCMAICNSKAVQIDGVSYSEDLFDLPEYNVDEKEFFNFLSARRSVRNFKDKPVPDELLNKILESIWYAPFGAHPEKVKITVINNREKIEESLPYISKFMDGIVSMIENPIASFFAKRITGKETFNTVKNHLYPISKLGNYKLEYGDRISRGAPALIIFHAEKGAEAHTNNSLIYSTYAMLAAHSLGLGSTMIEIISAAINKVKEVRNIFQIPDESEAVMSVIIGYPKYKYKRAVKRDMQNIDWIV